MISSLPDWITAGTAVSAVLGGLFGVYATTQSRMDVADERMANAMIILEAMAEEQERHNFDRKDMRDRLIKNEMNALYLKDGQKRVEASVTLLASEIKQLNQNLSK